MPSEPQIEILPYNKRKRFFLVLCAVFAILLPTMIFYTTGYRISLDDTENRIVTTGGLYITTDNLDVDVYMDDEQIRRPRLFRSAYYIQDVESGIHRVIVQQDGLHTWVKELPVDPYMVIEAAAFNMPLTPQLRPVFNYVTETGAQVVLPTATSTNFLAVGTTSTPLFFATSSATSSLTANPEHMFVASLFSTSTATSTSLVERFLAGVERFGFATTSATTTTVFTAPSKGNISLNEREGELYAVWTGEGDAIPYYYCVTNTASSSIAERYGDHVARQVEEQRVSTSTPLFVDNNRQCRREIQIDRKRQDVLFYDFLPGSSDLVLLQLEDGLYVTEIDDRAWQNTQQIFPGTDFRVVIENDTIYLKEGESYAELLTDIPED
jgi:hypothetical protein